MIDEVDDVGRGVPCSSLFLGGGTSDAEGDVLNCFTRASSSLILRFNISFSFLAVSNSLLYIPADSIDPVGADPALMDDRRGLIEEGEDATPSPADGFLKFVFSLRSAPAGTPWCEVMLPHEGWWR